MSLRKQTSVKSDKNLYMRFLSLLKFVTKTSQEYWWFYTFTMVYQKCIFKA